MREIYLDLVKAHDALLQKKDAPLFSSLEGLQAHADTSAANAPVVMIFAPHPDDECIIGALPLRLGREAGFKVVNVAVSQGSSLKRNPNAGPNWPMPANISALNCAKPSPAA